MQGDLHSIGTNSSQYSEHYLGVFSSLHTGRGEFGALAKRKKVSKC